MLQLRESRTCGCQMLFKKLLSTTQTEASPVLMNFSNNSSATFIKINCKGSKIKALLDSGAEITVINESFAKKLKLKTTLNPGVNLIGANNKPLEATGCTILEFEIGQIKLRQKAVVVKNLSTNLLLGTDWLKKNGIIMNYERNNLTLGKTQIKLETKQIQTECVMSAVNNIEIKPFSSHIEWVKVP